MTLKPFLEKARAVWGSDKLMLEQIIIRLGKIFGDICRFARNADKDKSLHSDRELKKELGNIIFSTVRWADDLGYDPDECVKIAIQAQEEFRAKNKNK